MILFLNNMEQIKRKPVSKLKDFQVKNLTDHKKMLHKLSNLFKTMRYQLCLLKELLISSVSQDKKILLQLKVAKIMKTHLIWRDRLAQILTKEQEIIQLDKILFKKQFLEISIGMKELRVSLNKIYLQVSLSMLPKLH